MAVYTTLEHDEIASFIKPFGIGPLVEFTGIADGIENTNYFITTDQSSFRNEEQTEALQHYVLTVFEELEADQLAFYIDYTTVLNQRGLPVPCPLTDANGNALHMLQHKPALLMPKIIGSHPEQPSPEQCRIIGQTLAQLHCAALDTKLCHHARRGLDWLSHSCEQLTLHVDEADQVLLTELLRFQQQIKNHPDLPQAMIHGDLFRDNTLFVGDQLLAVIDFYSAGNGYLLLDLAITVNDWCSAADGSLHQELSAALLSGYQKIRLVTADERLLWNDFLRLAALRFWVSRLIAHVHPEGRRSDILNEPKDPSFYKAILLQRIHSPQQLD